MNIDLSQINDFLALPPDIMMLKALYMVGWIPIAFVFLFGAKEMWMLYINTRWASQQKYTFLAIDIPRGNMQSPKAVENIFTYLLGAHGSLNLIDIYWEGKFQLGFSLEIVSIDGYTQFIIRTPVNFRNLVESAVYSQYPDAEITEIDDYTPGYPRKFPDERYDIWGAEFIQSHPAAYPIKTYPQFLDNMGKPEEQFKDPMASLMDLCSSLRKGEQLWYQIIIIPLGFDWMGIGEKEVKKIMKEKDPPKQNIVDKAANVLIGGLDSVANLIYPSEAGPAQEKKEEPLQFMNLRPREKKKVESIQFKVAKMAFGSKIRMIYLAEKEVKNNTKVVNGFVGHIKQFTDLDLNGLKPDMDVTATSASYFFKDYRINTKKTKIINRYMDRDASSGRSPGILNTEELATLWHFPIEAVVKAPLIQKAPGRKAEPPMSLPIGPEEEAPLPGEDIFSGDFDDDIFLEPEKGKKPEKKEKKVQGPVEKEDIFTLEDEEEEKPQAPGKTFHDESGKERGEPPSNLPFG